MMLTAHSAALEHDMSRVVHRFFLPGEGTMTVHSRMTDVIDRVLAIPQDRLDPIAEQITSDLAETQADAEGVLIAHARAVSDRIAHRPLSTSQLTILGSAVTSLVSVEGAALCNPSAVAHPSQAGLRDGELRVAVSLRGIGEGHVSSIGFAEAVIGADGTWTFGERSTPLSRAEVSGGEWAREHFGEALEDASQLGDLAAALLLALPDRFRTAELEAAIATLPSDLAMRPSSHAPLQALREMAESTYRAAFPADVPLSARVLMPVLPDEDHGIEDARFTMSTDTEDDTRYRATYTAYDGRNIAPRMLTSADLSTFDSHRLTGPGARNKGMALFPRRVQGRHLALSRGDGEKISLSASDDGVVWADLGLVYSPTEVWEIIQLGNCGAPIETPQGWLVLTHGVGPLRTYSLGALLLDLEDPTRVLARTTAPLLRPEGDMVDGYVPRVVYSCGGIVHRGTLWIPVGVGDSRIRVYSVEVEDLLESMTGSTRR